MGNIEKVLVTCDFCKKGKYPNEMKKLEQKGLIFKLCPTCHQDMENKIDSLTRKSSLNTDDNRHGLV